MPPKIVGPSGAYYQSDQMEENPMQVEFIPYASKVKFAARVPDQEKRRKGSVQLQLDEGGPLYPCWYALGSNGLLIEYDAGVAAGRGRREQTLELQFVPSMRAMVYKRPADTKLRITGSWPTYHISFHFLFEKEANDLRDELLAGIQRCILSLHKMEPPGAPPLVGQAPLNNLPGPENPVRAKYLLGGYVLLSSVRSSACPTPPEVVALPRYSLLWAELWASSKTMVRIYFYNSHKLDCCFHHSQCWPERGEAPLELGSGCVVCLDSEEPKDVQREEDATLGYIGFRTSQEAQVWMDMAAFGYDSIRGRPAASEKALARRIKEAAEGVLRSEQCAPREPFLEEESRPSLPPRPDPIPMDAVAVEARAEAQQFGDDIEAVLATMAVKKAAGGGASLQLKPSDSIVLTLQDP